MKELTDAPAGQAVQLSDIYYTLFRHKGKILMSTLAGLAAAAVLYFLYPPMFESQAKLFVRYVIESRSISPTANDPQVRSPDSRGENIINSELQILTSLDLAQQVAEAIGPQKILLHGGSNVAEAAIVLQKNLEVSVPPRSSIIAVTFQHPDPAIVQPVLRHVVDGYFRKHLQIHRATGVFDEFLTQQTDELRSRLAQTEQDLRKVKAAAGVFSVEDARKSINDQIAKISQDLLTTEAELAERKAALKELSRGAPATTKGDEPPTTGLSPETMAEYKRISQRVEQLSQHHQDLLLNFKDASPLVKDVRAQLTIAETLKKQLEKANPWLTSLVLTSGKDKAGEKFDVATESAHIIALQAKTEVLKAQLERIRTNGLALEEVDAAMSQLQRKRQLEDTQYRYFAASLEQARIDDTLGAGKLSNITEVQAPSPAAPAPSKRLKFMLAAIFAGVAAGIGLAFLLDLYLDQSVKRSSDLRGRLHIPVFVSIPYANGRFRLSATDRKRLGPELTQGVAVRGASAKVAPWDTNHKLHDYWETLRDRLITYFEVQNLTQKPKLVAVTGCGRGSGVTTIATGLAASLSETGDGNVLLVDMNSGKGAVHPFSRGKPGCGLSELLESGKNEEAWVQNNLYLAQDNSNDQGLRGTLAKRFHGILTKLKASNYDYIIFDMPAVNQTSITPRLANLMDMILLVIESERTDQHVAKRAVALLKERGGIVEPVVNKVRSYLPKRLQEEV